MRTSIPRIRRVRFKAGCEVVKIRSARDDVGEYMVRRAKDMANEAAGQHIAGFAIVAWSNSGESWVLSHVDNGSRIPPLLVPEFVRNALLGDRIENWTIDHINGG